MDKFNYYKENENTRKGGRKKVAGKSNTIIDHHRNEIHLETVGEYSHDEI
jgi:hypothetical protein